MAKEIIGFDYDKPIKGREDLRALTRQLKKEISSKDYIDHKFPVNKNNDNFVTTAAANFLSRVKNDNSFTNQGVNTVLTFLGTKATEKFKISGKAKLAITLGITFLTPIVVKKIQQFVEDRFEN